MDTILEVQIVCLDICTPTLPDSMVRYYDHHHHEHHECQIGKEGKVCNSCTCSHTREALNPEPIASLLVDALHIYVHK